MTPAHRLCTFVVCFVQVGCLPIIPRSQVIVCRSGSRSGDSRKVEAVCDAVARAHGLVLAPSHYAFFPDTPTYLRPLRHGFSAPQLLINEHDPDPNTLATITILGEEFTDSGRKEIAADAFDKLQSTFGVSRVRYQEERYIEF